jgi:hypothetical protein
MDKNPQISIVCDEIKEEFFQKYYSKSKDKRIDTLITNLKSELQNNGSIEDFKRKFFPNFLKGVISLVKHDEINHRDFDFESMKNNKTYKTLAKVILLKRIEELKNAQVEKKGKKYYVEELKKTYFGEYIMDNLDFSRRSVLMEDEYNAVVAAIKKLNYEVPIVVQPTKTELFFKD